MAGTILVLFTAGIFGDSGVQPPYIDSFGLFWVLL